MRVATAKNRTVNPKGSSGTAVGEGSLVPVGDGVLIVVTLGYGVEVATG